MSMKNPLTLAGIEPATFQFVAQHLNQCATAVPDYIMYILYYNFTLEVSAQKMKALTVKVYTVTLVKVGRIWRALC